MPIHKIIKHWFSDMSSKMLLIFLHCTEVYLEIGEEVVCLYVFVLGDSKYNEKNIFIYLLNCFLSHEILIYKALVLKELHILIIVNCKEISKLAF
uniref:Uncharacterized protein n=1 Tax=Octopus bimaculoides TaxID=37653 RepID=A0A0L8H061_OCTBM